MRTILLSSFFLVFGLTFCNAQVGVGTQTPKSNLQIVGNPASTTTADGIQVPALSLAQLDAKVAAYGTDQDGAIVYIDDISTASTVTKTANITETGYYYYDASSEVWKTMGGASSVPAPKIVGWLQEFQNTSSPQNSEKTIGNLKFRWNSNNYLEVQRVSNVNSYNATMKHYTGSDGLKTFIGNLTDAGQTQYSVSEWRPIYRTWDGSGFTIPPVGLGTYHEMHIELYEQTAFNNVTGFATYSIKTFKNGWGQYSYTVTYNIILTQ